MTDVVIRPERPEDAAAARAVHIDAFPVPDGEVQSVESVLVDWLREDGDVLWPLTLVAERDGQIVGSVVCSRGTRWGWARSGCARHTKARGSGRA